MSAPRSGALEICRGGEQAVLSCPGGEHVGAGGKGLAIDDVGEVRRRQADRGRDVGAPGVAVRPPNERKRLLGPWVATKADCGPLPRPVA